MEKGKRDKTPRLRRRKSHYRTIPQLFPPDAGRELSDEEFDKACSCCYIPEGQRQSFLRDLVDLIERWSPRYEIDFGDPAKLAAELEEISCAIAKTCDVIRTASPQCRYAISGERDRQTVSRFLELGDAIVALARRQQFFLTTRDLPANEQLRLLSDGLLASDTKKPSSRGRPAKTQLGALTRALLDFWECQTGKIATHDPVREEGKGKRKEYVTQSSQFAALMLRVIRFDLTITDKEIGTYLRYAITERRQERRAE